MRRRTASSGRPSRGGCFLTTRPDPARLGRAVHRPWEYAANCPHGWIATNLLATDYPLTTRGRTLGGEHRQEATPGKLPSPSDSTRRAPSHRRVARAVSSSTYRPGVSRTALAGRSWNGVGLSPVSVIGHCEQARPPYTPRAGGQNRDVLLRDNSLRNRPVLQHKWEPGTPHEAGLWPLPLYPCLAPSPPPVAGRRWLRTSPWGEFEQGFLDGHGPAQVGLGPPFIKG